MSSNPSAAGDGPGGSGRSVLVRTVLIAGVAVVVVVLLVQMLSSGSDEPDVAGSGGSGGTSTSIGASGSATPASSDSTPSATYTGSPSASEMSETASATPSSAAPKLATVGPPASESATEASVDEDGRLTKPPVALDKEGSPAPAVVVSLSKIEKVTGEAEVPGEVGGPSLRFTVTVSDASDNALDLRTTVVNAYYGDDLRPAIPLLKPGSTPFPERLAAGKKATGTFVFNVPVEDRDTVRVEVDLGVGSAIVLFEGSVR